MLGYQPMNLVLCQVVPYPPSEWNDEHKEREISSMDEDVFHLLSKGVMNVVSSSNKYIDKMEEILID